MRLSRLLLLLTIVLAVSGCAARRSANITPLPHEERIEMIRKAGVWQRTDIPSMNLRTGPTGPGSFAPHATVECRYVDKETTGNTPKFTCDLGEGRQVKVKYGRDNGEVYAEVAATRLLWALGFGADHMYPVRVICHGCPDLAHAEGVTQGDGVIFQFASIEHKMPGRELEGRGGPGWSWRDFDKVDPAAAEVEVARRDALKLLAVMLQHTDSKRQQQRLLCEDDLPKDAPPDTCGSPFLMINDLGRTFGRANVFNSNKVGSVNRKEWSKVPVWSGAEGCVGNLPRSFTGTLDNPRISEGGRRFLAELLVQLTDAQLYDMFDVARFPARAHDDFSDAEVQAWISAFKDKVSQISNRSCPTVRASS